jgi:hypothetical protein
MKHAAARKTWAAMLKFAENRELNAAEWEALSWLTMIDRTQRYFGPGNCRWARSEAERADNLKFYQSLGPTRH